MAGPHGSDLWQCVAVPSGSSVVLRTVTYLKGSHGVSRFFETTQPLAAGKVLHTASSVNSAQPLLSPAGTTREVKMVSYGYFWLVMVSSGKLWLVMESSGKLWLVLVSSGWL